MLTGVDPSLCKHIELTATTCQGYLHKLGGNADTCYGHVKMFDFFLWSVKQLSGRTGYRDGSCLTWLVVTWLISKTKG